MQSMSDKEFALEVVRQVPDGASYEVIEYYLYVAKRVELGGLAAVRGEAISHEEAVERLKKYRKPGDSRY